MPTLSGLFQQNFLKKGQLLGGHLSRRDKRGHLACSRKSRPFKKDARVTDRSSNGQAEPSYTGVAEDISFDESYRDKRSQPSIASTAAILDLERDSEVAEAGQPTEDEILTQQYLDSLGKDDWVEDPPGHRSGYIAILGRPNAGKSTLMNALIGQKLSIVTAKAQTTRHQILSLINDKAFQLVLLDTPGIMAKERNKLDTKMMKAVWNSARSADALIGIVDASANPEDAMETIKQLLSFKDAKNLPFALVLNKIDLISKTAVNSAIEYMESNDIGTILPISAKKGTGVEDVKNWAVNHLPQGPSLYPKDSISEEPERFFIAEMIREQIFLQYREEIPYCSTAQVSEYVTRPGAKDLVRVTVYVESEGQKAILLGRQGSAMKSLSTASRLAIEDFLGKPIYLDISIKVQKDWRSDEYAVSGLGY